jgi:hypothetical protein
MNPSNSTKQPTLRELVMQQTRINEDINKMLAVNDNIFLKKFMVSWNFSHLWLKSNISLIKRLKTN